MHQETQVCFEQRWCARSVHFIHIIWWWFQDHSRRSIPDDRPVWTLRWLPFWTFYATVSRSIARRMSNWLLGSEQFLVELERRTNPKLEIIRLLGSCLICHQTDWSEAAHSRNHLNAICHSFFLFRRHLGGCIFISNNQIHWFIQIAWLMIDLFWWFSSY